METAQSSENEISAQAKSAGKNVSILVVEDDPDDYKAIFRLLSKIGGYSIRTTRAPSGFDARNSLSRCSFDVVIADYRLGRETGVEVITSITRQRSDIGPILVTRCLSPEVQQAALNAGAVHCIDKDELSVTILESAIRTAIHKVLQQYVHGAFQDYAEETSGGERSNWLH